jgi:hypothetical protein
VFAGVSVGHYVNQLRTLKVYGLDPCAPRRLFYALAMASLLFEANRGLVRDSEGSPTS